MFDRIASLGRETALYGLSTVLGRMLNFLLVPLYANFLLPGENGVLATLYAYIAFAAVVYGLGMEQSFMRFWADASDERKPRVFRHSMAGSLPGVILSLAIIAAGEDAAVMLGFAPGDATLVVLAAVILVLDTMAAVPFVLLRMEHKPLRFALLKLLNIGLTLALTVLFVVPLSLGMTGVFFANACASFVTLVAVLGDVRSYWIQRGTGAWVDRELFRQLLAFGLPLVPAGLAGIALQVVDRPIVRALTDDATVGIYQLNFRLGVFMMLAVGMFDFAWRPFFLQHAKDPDAKPLFARVFSYFMTLLGTLFLLISAFVDDVVRIPLGEATFMPEEYWYGTSIVPVVLLGYAFTGAYVVFLTGVYMEKKTGSIPLISGVAAAVTIAGNFLMVPTLGIMGAAAATLAGRSIQAVWMYLEGQRWFNVSYEWRKIVTLVVWTGIIYFTLQYIDPEPLTIAGIGMKTGMLLLYVVGLFAGGIVTSHELRTIMTLRAGAKRSTDA